MKSLYSIALASIALGLAGLAVGGPLKFMLAVGFFLLGLAGLLDAATTVPDVNEPRRRSDR